MAARVRTVVTSRWKSRKRGRRLGTFIALSLHFRPQMRATRQAKPAYEPVDTLSRKERSLLYQRSEKTVGTCFRNAYGAHQQENGASSFHFDDASVASASRSSESRRWWSA